MSSRTRSTIEVAASRFREMALACDEGSFLGSEEALVDNLGVSRATVRQAARVLEREGFLRVKRGLNGGYFASRPNLDTVEAAVSAYLDTLDMDAADVTVVASVLWVEVMRKAASLKTEQARLTAEKIRGPVVALKADAPLRKVLDVETMSRTEIFTLTKARYIELIFQINIAFSRSRFPVSFSELDADPPFLETWRSAKLMEIEAICDGDPELGAMAARHSRNLWHRRIWGPQAAPAFS